jgi:uncharacterized repeat protein (TIGR01451 family)
VLRGQAVATVNGRTAWVSAWRDNSHQWHMTAENTTTWVGKIADLDNPPSDTNTKVSLAAADLDRDGNDEVVLGTLNTDGTSMRLSVYTLTLSMSSVTGITKTASIDVPYESEMTDIQVVLGDLDGDGKKEVGTGVLRGGYGEVYVSSYRYTGSSLSDMASFHSSVNKSTSDLEMAVARRYNRIAEALVVATSSTSQAYLQTYYFDPTTAQFDQDSGFSGAQTARIGGPYSTALAAGDIDNDGLDEIVYSYGALISVWAQGSVINSNILNYDDTDRSLAVGDVNMDGQGEIVYSTGKGTGQVRILKKIEPWISNQLTTIGSQNSVLGVPLLADLDGDSAVATFKQCREVLDVHVLGVVNSQPVWYQNTQSVQHSGGGMANSSNAISATQDGWSSSIGGSLSVGFEQELNIPVVDVKIGEVRSSLTQGFMNSVGGGSTQENSTTEANGVAFGLTNASFGLGAVCYTETSYTCYQYEVARLNSTITTTVMNCDVKPTQEAAPQECSSLEYWYSSAFKNAAGSSWAPVGHRLSTDSITMSVDLGLPNNYPVRSAPPVDPFRLWWAKATSIHVHSDPNPDSVASTWSVQKSTGTTTMKSGSFEDNIEVSVGATLFGVKVDASLTSGYGKNWSTSVSWGKGLEFSGYVYPYPENCTVCQDYYAVPYVYQGQAKTLAGVTYPYLEQDYYLRPPANEAALSEAPQSIVGVTPQAPVITSTTHPDPATWYPTSTVVLNWGQPAGDAAVVIGYKWNLDQSPVMTPTAVRELTTTQTYQDLADGVYYLHIQAVGDGGDLGPITHRAIRVDMNSPQVKFILDPAAPQGSDDWYNTPITVSVAATDTTGSGVVNVETSADGTTWLTYTAPIPITADTPGVTLWARAADRLGHTSDFISTTFKLDKTSPSTRDADSFGLSYANVITDEVGNAQLALGGALSDTLSGRLQVELKAQSPSGGETLWRAVSAVGELPMPPGNQLTTTMTSLNWLYTPTVEVRGVYPLWGRGVDAAGNYENAWIHGTFWWEPDDVPVLDESGVSVSPRQARPGDVLDFAVAARNSGYQESQLLITDTVPAGLTVLPDSIGDGGRYDANVRVITWTLHALWPGQTRYLFFKATANSVTTPITLENQLDLMAYWPWADVAGVPPEPARHYYSTTTTLTVFPNASASQAAPQVLDARVVEGEIVNDSEVTLLVNANPEARYLYVKEWTWNATFDRWSPARESGWVPFEAATGFVVSQDAGGKYGRYDWTLSKGDGVKYLGVWVADADGQISNVNEGNLIYTNLMSGSGQQLAAGQKVQYRVNMRASQLAVLSLVNLSGDADLYVWNPRAGFKPNYYSNAAPAVPGLSLDTVGFFAPEEGMYVVEVQAVADAHYCLVTAGDTNASLVAETQALARLTDSDVAVLKAQDKAMLDARQTLPQSTHLSLAEKDRPAHPLNLSTPYSLWRIEPPATIPTVPNVYQLYLPLVHG